MGSWRKHILLLITRSWGAHLCDQCPIYQIVERGDSDSKYTSVHFESRCFCWVSLVDFATGYRASNKSLLDEVALFGELGFLSVMNDGLEGSGNL